MLCVTVIKGPHEYPPGIQPSFEIETKTKTETERDGKTRKETDLGLVPVRGLLPQPLEPQVAPKSKS